MRDRIEIAVGPISDKPEASSGIQIDRVGGAAELRRHQQDPISEPSPADIGARIDQLAFDVVPLRLGVGISGVFQAMRRDALVFDRVTKRRGLAHGGGCRNDGQEIAAVEPSGSRSLDNRCRRRRLGPLCLFLLVFEELGMVLLGHLRPALQEPCLRGQRVRAGGFVTHIDLRLCRIFRGPDLVSLGPAWFRHERVLPNRSPCHWREQMPRAAAAYRAGRLRPR